MFCIMSIPSPRRFVSSATGGQFLVLKPNVSFSAAVTGFKKWKAFNLILFKNRSIFSIKHFVETLASGPGMFSLSS